MKIVPRILTTAALPVLMALPLQAATIESFNVAGWRISAYSNDQTQRFNHCSASVPYQNGVLLIFSIGWDYKWSMGLANPQWRLARGTRHNFTYTIDKTAPVPTVGRAVLDTLLEVELVDTKDVFERFRRGLRLNVDAMGQRFVFNLSSSSAALAAALDCTNKYAKASPGGPGPGRPSGPSARPGPQGPSSGPTAERQYRQDPGGGPYGGPDRRPPGGPYGGPDRGPPGGPYGNPDRGPPGGPYGGGPDRGPPGGPYGGGPDRGPPGGPYSGGPDRSPPGGPYGGGPDRDRPPGPYAGPGGPVPPPQPYSAPGGPPPDPAANSAEAQGLAADIVSGIGFPGFRVLTREQTPQNLQRHDTIWTAEGGITGIVNVEISVGGLDQVASGLTDADQRSCQGAFASARYPSDAGAEGARLMTACTGSNNPTHVGYSIVPRPKGGFYVFAVMGGEDKATVVHDMALKVHEAAGRNRR